MQSGGFVRSFRNLDFGRVDNSLRARAAEKDEEGPTAGFCSHLEQNLVISVGPCEVDARNKQQKISRKLREEATCREQRTLQGRLERGRNVLFNESPTFETETSSQNKKQKLTIFGAL